jgi:hypothetical protein
MDNTQRPARFQNAKTAAPKLRWRLAERYRYEILPTDHWHGDTLLRLTRVYNNRHRLNFLWEGHVHHNRMADAESR